ncbi:MAG: hypothetical protein IPM35_18460 [Myxococcales bacterium]|nr:hypothetical protein [Myxococcales bacterium]
MLGRRRFLWAIGAGAAGLWLHGRPARASIARALSLRELVRSSERALVGTALDTESRFESVGGRRRIVTYSRLRVEERLGGPGDESELLVRTLGGKVGDVGQVVHGEALLLLGEPALVFLGPSPEGPLVVTAMAQGHYPIRADKRGERRLSPSPRLAELVGDGAARELAGKRVAEATGLVRKAWDAR